MSESSPGRVPPGAALDQLIETWKARAMAAGQYSVECAITKGHEHHAAASEAFTLHCCIEELRAALDAQPPQAPQKEQHEWFCDGCQQVVGSAAVGADERSRLLHVLSGTTSYCGPVRLRVAEGRRAQEPPQ